VHPLQLLMNTVFIRRSFGVSSGKLAAIRCPRLFVKISEDWKRQLHLLLASAREHGFYRGGFKADGCAQILYWPVLNEGKEYRPL